MAFQMLRRLGLVGLHTDTRLVTVQPRNFAEALESIMQVQRCLSAIHLYCRKAQLNTINAVTTRTHAEGVSCSFEWQVGSAAGAAAEAAELVDRCRMRLRAVAYLVAKEHRPRILSLESVEPLVIGELVHAWWIVQPRSCVMRRRQTSRDVAGGQWLPEMKELAGGADDWQTPGDAAVRVSWEQV